MYEWLLVVLLDSKGSHNATLVTERFATQAGCMVVKQYVESRTDVDASECFKVLRLESK